MAAHARSRGSETVTFSAFRITLQPSRILLIYLCGVHGLAAIGVWLSALPALAGIVITPALALSLMHSVKRHRWSGERELIYKEGSWTVVENGEQQALQLAGESFIHPWITILHFKSTSGRMVFTLPFDSAEPKQLKQLRRVLRFGLQAESSDLSRQ